MALNQKLTDKRWRVVSTVAAVLATTTAAWSRLGNHQRGPDPQPVCLAVGTQFGQPGQT